MTDFIHSLFTDKALYIGIVIGFVMRHLYCLFRARWLDKHDPLPRGKRHDRPLINRSILSATLALCVVAFSLTTINSTRRDTEMNIKQTRVLAAETLKCENRLAESITADRKLQLQNDALAAVERDLNNDAISANSEWLALVVTPPQNIFDLHTTDPTYQAWARGVNMAYLDKLTVINQKLEEATAKRQAVVAERAKHPVPPPNCGKPQA